MRKEKNKDCKKIKLIPISINETGTKVIKQNYEVEKNEDLYFILEEDEGKYINKIPLDKFTIKIDAHYCEDIETEEFVLNNQFLMTTTKECKHIMKTNLSEIERKILGKKLNRKYSSYIASKIAAKGYDKNTQYNHHFIHSIKSGVTYRVYFIHKETGEESYINIRVKQNRLVLVPLLLIMCGSAIVAPYIIKNIHPSPTPDPDGPIKVTIENTEETSQNNNIIIFPDNLTTISVTQDNPYYLFRNNGVNHVYFHYYIYDYDTQETVDIGQIEPTDEFALKVNMLKFFTVGTHNVRLDIRTFKDKEETIEKHPMSYKCKITIK